MDRVRRIAGLMRGMVLVGGSLFTFFTLKIWADPEWIETIARQDLGLLPEGFVITPTVQWLGALVSLLPLSLGIFGMLQVWFLFGEYAQGRIFTNLASMRLRRLAWAVIGAAATQIVARTAHVLLLTMNNPPGKKVLTISISSTDYSFIIFGVLLLGIAWVMVEATRLAQENAEFI
ncbi:DUF2975 domain-containing protein [Piscinibacter terrae]|nr:DUF2975 domain-containing protein [Albitalea terrae]